MFCELQRNGSADRLILPIDTKKKKRKKAPGNHNESMVKSKIKILLGSFMLMGLQ